MSRSAKNRVVVVGAGPAGLLSAYYLTQFGLSVSVVDAKNEEDWGRHWVVDIDKRSILQRRLPIPDQASVTTDWLTTLDFFSPSGLRAVHLAPSPVMQLHLGHYKEGLRRSLEEAGTTLHLSRSVTDIQRMPNGLVKVCMEDRHQGSLEETVGFVVLACGLLAERFKERLTHEFGIPWSLGPSETMEMGVRTFQIQKDGLDVRLPSPIGTYFCRMGNRGPLSVGCAGISNDRHWGLVTARRLTALQEHDSVKHMLNSLQARLGSSASIETGFGGLVPVRRPQDVLARRGVALVGSAASQSYPLTGAGITLAARAAAIMADAVAQYRANGRNEEALWQYSVAYHRHFGATQAFAQTLMGAFQAAGMGQGAVESWFRSGAMSPEDIRRSLLLSPTDLSAWEVVKKWWAVLPGQGRSVLGGALIRGVGAYNVYQKLFPREPSDHGLARFSRAARLAVFGKEELDRSNVEREGR